MFERTSWVGAMSGASRPSTQYYAAAEEREIMFVGIDSGRSI